VWGGNDVTFGDGFVAAFIALAVISAFLPMGKVISAYDAGMFALYLVVLAWGVLRVVDGEQRNGWALIITAAGLFGWRMYSVFNDRKQWVFLATSETKATHRKAHTAAFRWGATHLAHLHKNESYAAPWVTESLSVS
jgi:hypothetical protein